MKVKVWLVLFAVFLVGVSFVQAQTYEWGIHGTLNVNQLIPQRNNVSSNLFIREGNLSGGAGFGLTFFTGPPKNQPKKWGLDYKSFYLFESSVCRCEGNLSATVELPNKTRNIISLNYIFYRYDVSAKWMFGVNKLRLMIGPTFTYLNYVGYRIDKQTKLYNAEKEFNAFNYGYEYGLGVHTGPWLLSLRYQSILNQFGKQFSGTSINLKNSQIRFVVNLRIRYKEKGKNWESIKWD